VAVASIGDTAYVVGGYNGTSALDTIVSWSPGGSARVVARLPTPLRYAAAASVDGRVIVAGGSREETPEDEILSFDPATGAVVRIGHLPAPLTHATAATLGSTVYVVGGRGGSSGSQTATVLAIDSRSGLVRLAGRLPLGISDAAAVATQGAIVVAGGRAATGAQAGVFRLQAVAAP
jgi:N-acetylneuraminic acid mutarotase